MTNFKTSQSQNPTEKTISTQLSHDLLWKCLLMDGAGSVSRLKLWNPSCRKSAATHYSLWSSDALCAGLNCQAPCTERALQLYWIYCTCKCAPVKTYTIAWHNFAEKRAIVWWFTTLCNSGIKHECSLVMNSRNAKQLQISTFTPQGCCQWPTVMQNLWL